MSKFNKILIVAFVGMLLFTAAVDAQMPTAVPAIIPKRDTAKAPPSQPTESYAEKPAYESNYDKTVTHSVSQSGLSIQALFDEMNYARQNPKEYAKKLNKSKDAASKETIAFLNKQPSRNAFIFSKALAQTAFDHCKDMNDKKFFSHTGSNGSSPWNRIAKYANESGTNENISAGGGTAEDIIMRWIIDRNEKSKGHRMAIFSDKNVYCGVAWYKHPKWHVTVTADFAGSSFTSKLKDDNTILEFYK